MIMPALHWSEMASIDTVGGRIGTVMLRVEGRPVLACWHCDPASGRSFWWNGEMTDDGDLVEVDEPTGWALVDLDGYRAHYEAIAQDGR